MDLHKPVDALKDRFEDVVAEAERRVRVRLCLEAIGVNLSGLKDLDPKNAALYADLQVELAARK